MKLDKEFKAALSHLPEQEKDKLLFRLLKKDVTLANRLWFELMDDATVDEHRQNLEEEITESIERQSKRYYSPGILMMELRDISGEITAHVTTTKDKFGEVSLNLVMLVEVLKKNKQHIEDAPPARSRKLCVYIISRSFKILTLIHKLHPDLFLELRENLTELGWLIGNTPVLMKTAIHHGLDVNWLISGDIPEDITELQRELRRNGYLK